MPGSPTALGLLGIGAADPVDTALNFTSFDPGVTRELANLNGTRGTFFPDSNRFRENRKGVNPRFSSEPTSLEAATLLEWMMGGTPTGTTTKTYPWSNTPAARNLHFKPVSGEEWFLGNVTPDNSVLQATVGGALSFDFDLIGQTHDDTRSNMPALSYDQTYSPFMLADLVLTVGGVVRRPRDFHFSVAGGIDRDRFLNSLTLTALLRVNAMWNVSFEVPSGDNASNFWRSGLTGAAATAVFTSAANGAVLTLDFPRLMYPANSPAFAPGSEGYIRINAICARVTTGNPVNITLYQGT